MVRKIQITGLLITWTGLGGLLCCVYQFKLVCVMTGFGQPSLADDDIMTMVHGDWSMSSEGNDG